ncbi:MAG: hypothetical protein ACOYXB_00560 [Bacteroidota bacterium]
MKMKTLENIYSDLQPGDIVLFQFMKDVTPLDPSSYEYAKPELAVIVGIDVVDMALSVLYVNYKSFNYAVNKYSHKTIEIEDFAEWMDYWNILGHWRTTPPVKTLLRAYRKAKPYKRTMFEIIGSSCELPGQSTSDILKKAITATLEAFTDYLESENVTIINQATGTPVPGAIIQNKPGTLHEFFTHALARRGIFYDHPLK